MSIKVKKLPNSERPYEKLEMYGENAIKFRIIGNNNKNRNKK